MERWIGRWNTSTVGTFVQRVPQLQTTFESWHRRTEGFAKFKAVGFGVFAITMGIMAYNKCCEETSLAWVKSHFPSQTVWGAALNSEGLQLVKDPKILAKTLKNLPARVESGNQAWEGLPASGPSWWVVYPGKGQSDPLIFCQNCDVIPKKWQPVGEGWSALDTIIMQVRSAPHILFAKKSPLKIAEVIDPREIRY